MDKVAICLGSAGWQRGVIEKLDTLLADFLVSAASQTQLYPGSVASFVWLCGEYGHTPNDMATQTKLTLERYLSNYFDTVVVETDFNYPNEEDKTGYNLSMYINVVENGTTYDTRKLFELKDGKLNAVIGASNAT